VAGRRPQYLHKRVATKFLSSAAGLQLSAESNDGNDAENNNNNNNININDINNNDNNNMESAVVYEHNNSPDTANNSRAESLCFNDKEKTHILRAKELDLTFSREMSCACTWDDFECARGYMLVALTPEGLAFQGSTTTSSASLASTLVPYMGSPLREAGSRQTEPAHDRNHSSHSISHNKDFADPALSLSVMK
jgi:hypothetical protein